MQIAHRKDVLFKDWHGWRPEVLDTATNLCSGCHGYAHSELVFDNGLSFTSSISYNPPTAFHPAPPAIGRKNGPIIHRVDLTGDDWVFTDLDLTDSQKLQIWSWCVKTIDESLAAGAGYDFAGVLRFVLPFIKEHPQDWFCSESVVAACQSAGLFPGEQPWRCSPNRLAKLCGV